MNLFIKSTTDCIFRSLVLLCGTCLPLWTIGAVIEIFLCAKILAIQNMFLKNDWDTITSFAKSMGKNISL